LLVALVGCGAGVAGEAQTGRDPDGADRVHTITMTLPGGAVDAEEAAGFEGLIESLSRGRIAVEIDEDGRGCDDPAACLAALQAGTIDAYRSTVPDIGRLMPALHVLDVPYLLETDEVVELVFRGVFFARMRDALLHGTGLRLMALGSAGGWRGIATTSRAVRTPADLQGLALRTADSPIEMAWARALGASPVSAPWREVRADLASGRIQGTGDGAIDIVRGGLQEDLRHLTPDRHGYRAGLWLMNEQAYQALPADLRPVVQAGFDELARVTLARTRERYAEAIAAFEAAGGRVHEPTLEERRSFVMAAGRVSTGYMDEHGYEWLVWLEGAIAEAERELAVANVRQDRARP
jgi:TRAP-type C4-dicarboxylate transport system substrate-binding protein